MNKKILIGILIIVAILIVFGMFGEEKQKNPQQIVPTSGGVFVKSLKNPVMPSGPEDAWNNLKTDPTVLKDGDIYKMWFNTSDKEGEYTKLAYAESKDGINWEFYPKPVLEPGYDDSWEGTDVETPTVIKDDEAPQEERYKMWYAGWVEKKETYRIGYATSPDGINWTKYKDNPVLDIGKKESWDWDGWTVTDPMVLKKDDGYHLWYSGTGEVPQEKTWHFWIGYATSKDGIHWEKYSENPVLDIGSKGSFESRAVGQPAVLFNGKEYEMWYSGWDEIDKSWSSQIGYAISIDGIHWTKSSENPVLKKGGKGKWDMDQLVAPSVILDGDEFKMWYTGMKIDRLLGSIPYNQHIGIGYATMEKEKQK